MRFIDPIFYCSSLILATSVLADSTESVLSCLRAKNVPYEVEKSASWTSLVTPYSLALQDIPAVITVPLTSEQLGSTVGCAVEHGFNAQARVGLGSHPNYVITQWKIARYSWFGLRDLFGRADSRIDAVTSVKSAESDQDALGVSQNHANAADHPPPYLPEITAFINSLTRLVATNRSDDFSANSSHLDPELSPTRITRLSQAKQGPDKQIEFKKQIDPEHVFWKTQALKAEEGSPVSSFMDAAGRLGLIGGWLVLYLVVCGIGLGSFFSDQKGSGCLV